MRWWIDILTGIDGVSFAEAWSTRVEAEFVAKPLYVIGREMLLRNKRAAGRDKDLLDVALLEEHGPAAEPAVRRPMSPKKKQRRR